MATKKVCDVCGAEATGTMEFKTDKTTPLIKDLCEKHLERIKKFMNRFVDGKAETDPGS